ncbi:hypothetical protein ACFX2I_006732 [Malus domestica]
MVFTLGGFTSSLHPANRHYCFYLFQLVFRNILPTPCEKTPPTFRGIEAKDFRNFKKASSQIDLLDLRLRQRLRQLEADAENAIPSEESVRIAFGLGGVGGEAAGLGKICEGGATVCQAGECQGGGEGQSGDVQMADDGHQYAARGDDFVE